MLDLRLVGVHADGDHLLLADENGERYRVVIDQSLRDAVRRDRAHAPAGADGADTQLRPRDVQSLLRSGVSVEEVAERSGWSIEKIQRYEPPVRAERDHVALLVQDLPVHRPTPDAPDSFGERAIDRLLQRGVDRQDIRWDSWRTDEEWTVIAVYPAGGRLRQATWVFDPKSQSVRPTDDEARWLGEDDASDGGTRRDASVFDLEANGGFDHLTERRSGARRVPGSSRPAEPAHVDDGAASNAGTATGSPADTDTPEPDAAPQDPREKPVDLVSVMRERSKGRRRRSRRSDSAATAPERTAANSTAPEPTESTGPAEPPSADHDSTGQDEQHDIARDQDGQLDHDPVTGTKDLFASLDDAEDDSGDSSGDDFDATAAEAEDAADLADDGAGTGRTHDAGDPDDLRSEPAARQADDLDEDTEEIVVPSRPAKARKGRPSVPSWDDIMFGANPRFED